jgi:hypothetical protein
MAVQDDERERELVRMFNLHWDPAHQRAGVDAILDLEVDGKLCRFEIEVKSTTTSSVSTARDVGIEHIKKWRNKFFIIGFYTKDAKRPELISSLCLTPDDMEPWIASIENKISTDFQLARLASKRIQLSDVLEICEKIDPLDKSGSYSMAVAKSIHKQQWSAEQYKASVDTVVGKKKKISAEKMLEIVQLRAKYIAERGATLNNPHITKSHLTKFLNTNRVVSAPNWAQGVKDIAIAFVRSNPTHPSIGICPPKT